jgi:hypothetical protein
VSVCVEGVSKELNLNMTFAALKNMADKKSKILSFPRPALIEYTIERPSVMSFS